MIARRMAREDGAGAVELLRRASLLNNDSAVSQVAVTRITREPEATIDWLQSLSNDEVRTAALGEAARVWAGVSPAEAEGWILAQPNNEERDAILYSMLTAALVSEAMPSETLFRAFSNDRARQIAAVNIAREVESYDETEARRLLDRYVSDARLRQSFERREELPSPN
jgi:hypothetical protein